MKNWKKLLKSQLNEVVPPLDEEIKNMPISVRSDASSNGGGTLVRSKKNTIIAIAAAVLAVIITGIVLLCTLPLGRPAEQFIFTVEINPSATFVTDGDGKVINIISSNSDADVILSDGNVKARIIGKSLSDAIINYTDSAGRLGYIDADKKGSAIRISACERGTEILTTAKSSLESYLIDKGIFAVVVDETVALNRFTERCGITADSIKNLTNTLKSCDTLYSDRLAQAADGDMLKTLYTEIILSSSVVNNIKEYVLGNLTLIKQFEAFLPPFVSVDRIESILNELSSEILAQYSNLLADVLKLIGKENELTTILRLPQTALEFADKLAVSLKIEFAERKNEFENLYNQARNATQEQYDSFIEDIIDAYGSLSGYWDAVK